MPWLLGTARRNRVERRTDRFTPVPNKESMKQTETTEQSLSPIAIVILGTFRPLPQQQDATTGAVHPTNTHPTEQQEKDRPTNRKETKAKKGRPLPTYKHVGFLSTGLTGSGRTSGIAKYSSWSCSKYFSVSGKSRAVSMICSMLLELMVCGMFYVGKSRGNDDGGRGRCVRIGHNITTHSFFSHPYLEMPNDGLKLGTHQSLCPDSAPNIHTQINPLVRTGTTTTHEHTTHTKSLAE